jgi:hypothetical protein
MTNTVLSRRPKTGSPAYGYGFSVKETSAGRVAGHGGGFTGISANLDMFLDAGFTAAALSNYDNGADHVQEKIEELVVRLQQGAAVSGGRRRAGSR